VCHFAASLGVDAIAVGVEINSRLCVRALIKKASRPPINAQSAAEMTHTERFHFKAGRKVTLLHQRSNLVSQLGSFIHLRVGSAAETSLIQSVCFVHGI
jgi:hypothetical protein